MGQGNNTARVISLGDDFGAVTVNVNGVSIDVDCDGKIEIHSASNDDAKPKISSEITDEDPTVITKPGPANDDWSERITYGYTLGVI